MGWMCLFWKAVRCDLDKKEAMILIIHQRQICFKAWHSLHAWMQALKVQHTEHSIRHNLKLLLVGNVDHSIRREHASRIDWREANGLCTVHSLPRLKAFSRKPKIATIAYIARGQVGLAQGQRRQSCALRPLRHILNKPAPMVLAGIDSNQRQLTV